MNRADRLLPTEDKRARSILAGILTAKFNIGDQFDLMRYFQAVRSNNGGQITPR